MVLNYDAGFGFDGDNYIAEMELNEVEVVVVAVVHNGTNAFHDVLFVLAFYCHIFKLVNQLSQFKTIAHKSDGFSQVIQVKQGAAPPCVGLFRINL